MTQAVVIKQADVQKLIAALTQVSRGVATKHLRIGLNAWGGLVREVARENALRDTSLLIKSLSVKVIIPAASRNAAHHGKPARVMVCPDRNAVRASFIRKGVVKLLTDRKATKAVLSGAKVRVRKPSRYAHLVERKEPFIAPATAAGAGPGFDKLATKLREGLEQEASKANKG